MADRAPVACLFFFNQFAGLFEAFYGSLIQFAMAIVCSYESKLVKYRKMPCLFVTT